MSSSCLSGGGRAYRLNVDLIKPPPPPTFSTSNSSSSSPSSTLSESSNSPLSIFTRKPRTPRKRPNQTYNEAAAILSTAYPKLFPAKNLTKPFKLTKSHDDNRGPFLSDPPDPLIHCPPLLQCPPLPSSKLERPCRSPGEVTSISRGNDLLEICGDEFEEDFDAESILDEEVEEGIDSIMGNLRVEEEAQMQSNRGDSSGYCYGFPVGLGFDFGFGMRAAMRNVDEGDWWSSPTVNVVDISLRNSPMEKKKKKKTKKKTENLGTTTAAASSHEQENLGRLRLKLNYDDVLSAWSDKASPFSGDAPGADSAGIDVQERLAQIELFPENGAGRGAIVLRYKEKRRSRLFSKKIRYQVRKANADQRPRIKGRFVRTPNSADDD